jgi:dinuclear metal center YbgI/SA1388 family protein
MRFNMNKTKLSKLNKGSANKTLTVSALDKYLCQAMNVPSFKDYCPNGLQVEGVSQISRVALAVTASQNAIDAAVEWGAQALLVHHGLFWKSDSAVLVGPMRKRVGSLVKANMNLFAYHLPLDCHPDWGNNKALGNTLGWSSCKPLSVNQLIWGIKLKRAITSLELSKKVSSLLERTPTLVGQLDRPIRTIAWCTGGAQGYLKDAIDLGADAFISGEISEQTTHLARESGVLFVSAGHHATERYGVQSLGAHLASKFGLEVRFFEDTNPA